MSLFLRLDGEKNGQRVAFEARLMGSEIQTVVCNRETGQAEGSGTGVRYHRVALFIPGDEDPLTVFDLLPTDNPARLVNTRSLQLDLAVRSLLSIPLSTNPPSRGYVQIQGNLEVQTTGATPGLSFRQLTAAFNDESGPTAYRPFDSDFRFRGGTGTPGSFPLSELAGKQVRALPLNARNLLREALEIKGDPHSGPPLILSFKPLSEGSKKTLLTFTKDIEIDNAESALSFRQEKIKTSGHSTWTFLQRAPLSEEGDEERKLEGRENRWTVIVDSGPGARTADLLRLWNERVATPYLNGLRMVQGGRAISALPQFVEGTRIPLRIVYELREPHPQRDQIEGDEIAFPDDRAQNPSGARVLGRVRSIQPGKASQESVSSSLPGMLTHDGLPLQIAWRVLSPAPDEIAAEQLKETGLVIGALHLRQESENSQTVRLGSLDLSFPPPALNGTPAGTATLLTADLVPPGSGLPFVDLTPNLAVVQIAPGGQDGLPQEEFVQNDPDGFEREPALVIPTGTPERRNLSLQIEEDTRQDRSQTLVMRLRDDTQGTAAPAQQDVVVIDRQPFLVAKVEVPALRGAGDDREIGNWSGDSPHGASWELRAGEGFTMHLPPQGVGEAMEKVEGPADIEKNEPADFRFTPPAKLELLASFFAQRFAEAPWNLRRILGYPGQRAPGAGIRRLQFEMLYGLGCEVDTDFLRLAEIASRLGAIPGDLPDRLPWSATEAQEKTFQTFKNDWAEVYGRYFTRLAVLEPWDDHQPVELTLEDGVRYQLRRNADLRYPILGETLPEALRGKIPASPSGLAGGVAWGFESANIYHATWRDPKSTSAKLARPYFSALGGWGFQKASFDKDRTTIYSDTAMGRTFFLSLERIGRIGTLWNVAKHVIIYERTVVRAAQFDDDAVRPQDPHEGRPVLRKVREFVEILQPVRGYPESSATPAATRGFVVGSEFKSRIINVDSAWGADVGTIGFQVPLWRPDAARVQPAIYPKPQILLEVGADPEGGSATLRVEIEEPEKLVFYTDTRETTDARTDLWPAVEGIDYLDLPRPEPPSIKGYAGSDLDRPLPDAPAVEPGFDRFTWAVAPPERGANLVQDRADEPMAAVIRNVTMMRASSLAKTVELPPDAEAALQELAGLSFPAEAILQEMLARVPTGGQVTAEVVERLKRELKAPEVLGQLKDLRKKLDTLRANPEIGKLLTAGEDLCDKVVEQCIGTLTKLETEATALRDELRKVLLEKLQPLQGQAESLRVEARRLLAKELDKLRQLARGIEGGLALVSQQVPAALDEINRLEGRILAEIQEVESIAKALETATTQEIDRLRSRLRETRQRVTAFLREVDSRLATISEPRLANIAGQVRTKLDEARRAVEKGLGKADSLLAQADPDLTQVQAALASLRTEVKVPFDVLRSTVGQANDALQQLSSVVRQVQDGIDEVQKRGGDAIDKFFKEQPEVLVDELDKALEEAFQLRIVSKIATLKTTATEALTKICTQLLQELESIFKSVEDFLGTDGLKILEEIGKRLDSALANGATTAEALRSAVEAEIDRLRSHLAPLANQLQDGVREAVKKLINGPLSQLGDPVLRLLRAFGDAPIVPNLGFNRKQIAYFFDELKKSVDLTPVTALVNRLGDELKALGLRVPTKELLDRILPDALQNFDLSKLLPDFAGLKLDNLFPGLKMPSLANDRVKVTQGIDRQSRRAWVQADVDVPVDQPSTLFSTGPVTVRLLRARFRAQARIETGLDGQTRQTTKGDIRGDWQISVLNTPIVVFRDTALIFEDGRVRFELSPEKVEFTEALRFLADLMKKIGYTEGGFSIRLLEGPNGIPVGVQSVLDLPLPDVAAGAFALTSLRLGSTFTLRVEPGPGGIEFSLATRFHLGTKEAPFALTIAILTGGGWLDASAFYTPRTGVVKAQVSIGVVAGASLAFAFGPVRGGVYIFFGIEVEYQSVTGQEGSLNVAILLLVRGEVRVLGFITVGLHLLLQAQYQQNGRLVGTGTLSLSIKISRFFTIKVRTSVRYVFAKGSGGGAAALAAAGTTADDLFQTAAAAYIGMLE